MCVCVCVCVLPRMSEVETLYHGSVTKRAVKSARNWKSRYVTLVGCVGDDEMFMMEWFRNKTQMESGKAGKGHIMIFFDTTVQYAPAKRQRKVPSPSSPSSFSHPSPSPSPSP